MRQFLDRMDKPRVDEIRGIPPAIAIEQANPVKSSRSTVGTMTEINDYLKLLWPRIAHAFCPELRPRDSAETRSRSRTNLAHFLHSRVMRANVEDLSPSAPEQGDPPLRSGEDKERNVARSPSGFPFRRKPSRAISSTSSNNKAICAFGSTAKLCASMPNKNQTTRRARAGHSGSHRDLARKIATRLVEAIEIALRFGKGQDQSFVDSRFQNGASLLDRLALRALRSRYSPADAGTFQFQQSVRRLSGMSRFRSHHRDRSEPRDSRSLALDRTGRGARFSR